MVKALQQRRRAVSGLTDAWSVVGGMFCRKADSLQTATRELAVASSVVVVVAVELE